VTTRKLVIYQVFDLSAEQAGKKMSKPSLPAGKGRAYEVFGVFLQRLN
jgi:hypothetical protein